MKRLDIKEYIATEKEKLKNLKDIKLGIIGKYEDAAAIINDFEELGWKAALYKLRQGETSCHDAIIRAIDHRCTGIIAQPEGNFDPYMIPRRLDCGGIRPDALVNPILPQSIIDYLKACEFPFSGRTAVVLGSDSLSGAAMARLLLAQDMTVSVCHNKSDKSVVSGLLCDADLVVCGTGRQGAIVRNQCMDAVVIDCGGVICQNKNFAGEFEEKPEFCTDTTWSISNTSGVNLLARLGLLKNCAALVERG